MFHSVKLFRNTIVVAIAVFCAALIGSAQPRSKNAGKLANAAKESQSAADTFTAIMNVRDKAIPQALLDKAEAIARAKELAKAESLGQVVIQRKDGQIQTEHTYGQDPERSRG